MQKRGFQLLLLTITAAFMVCTLLISSLCMGAPAIQDVTITIDGDSTLYSSSDSSIPLRWGNVDFGCNTKTVTITNNAESDLHINMAVSELPSGWTLNFSLENKVLQAGSSATGTLTLTVPADALAGSYHWNTNIALCTVS
ncbi:MAG: NEW3 domain-containing protein [Candidatus Bathyarchaeota archaeon]|nr:NEW3 domain-containing protein [Candidatus Bathyarchaeota archaeon]